VKGPLGKSGLTILEVVIALLVLVVGVLAVAGLQASGLQASRTARALQNMNADARSELEVWRGAYLPYLTPTSRSCTTTAAGCTVEIRPCVVAGQDLECDRPSVTAAAAHAVTVTVEEEGRVIALTTVVLR
jgi:Tfp pilus assembly protein PilV